ncbi:MAG: hypothetical protein CM1200mP5_0990 [Candidatus Pelagibacterales bacterium]|nr:MAG: hypothetical protein CM1200mP5_0990 [Pelagibacterales bacterium]
MKKISIDSNKSPNFIGSWNIENDKLCNEIIKFFEDNESLQKKGSTALGYNPKIKQTTDITIIPSELKDPKYSLFNSYFNLLKDCFLDYRSQYPFLKHKFLTKLISVILMFKNISLEIIFHHFILKNQSRFSSQVICMDDLFE